MGVGFGFRPPAARSMRLLPPNDTDSGDQRPAASGQRGGGVTNANAAQPASESLCSPHGSMLPCAFPLPSARDPCRGRGQGAGGRKEYATACMQQRSRSRPSAPEACEAAGLAGTAARSWRGSTSDPQPRDTRYGLSVGRQCARQSMQSVQSVQRAYRDRSRSRMAMAHGPWPRRAKRGLWAVGLASARPARPARPARGRVTSDAAACRTRDRSRCQDAVKVGDQRPCVPACQLKLCAKAKISLACRRSSGGGDRGDPRMIACARARDWGPWQGVQVPAQEQGASEVTMTSLAPSAPERS